MNRGLFQMASFQAMLLAFTALGILIAMTSDARWYVFVAIPIVAIYAIHYASANYQRGYNDALFYSSLANVLADLDDESSENDDAAEAREWLRVLLNGHGETKLGG